MPDVRLALLTYWILIPTQSLLHPTIILRTNYTNRSGPNMTYQLYRNTTLGNTLQESIDEMIQVTILWLFHNCIASRSDVPSHRCDWLCAVHRLSTGIFYLCAYNVSVWSNNTGTRHENLATVRQVCKQLIGHTRQI